MAIEAVGREAGDAEESLGDGGAPRQDIALLAVFVEEDVGAEDLGAEAGKDQRGFAVWGWRKAGQ